MPCEYAGFTLKPLAFCERNPGIDLARVGFGARRSLCSW